MGAAILEVGRAWGRNLQGGGIQSLSAAAGRLYRVACGIEIGGAGRTAHALAYSITMQL
jgi:hypothetical protein